MWSSNNHNTSSASLRQTAAKAERQTALDYFRKQVGMGCCLGTAADTIATAGDAAVEKGVPRALAKTARNYVEMHKDAHTSRKKETTIRVRYHCFFQFGCLPKSVAEIGCWSPVQSCLLERKDRRRNKG